jgi:hypothetical protein
MTATRRVERLRQYIDECKKHGDIFTPTELEHIVEDVEALFTPVVVDLVKLLIQQQLPAARRATPPKLKTFPITDSDIAAIIAADRAEHG